MTGKRIHLKKFIMKTRYEEKYARLMLSAGVGLQKGQKIYIQMESYHISFARVIEREAYKMGASYVLVETTDPHRVASRVRYGNEQDLGYLPPWIEERNRLMVEEKWARIFFFGPEFPDLLSSLDQGRLAKVQAAARMAAKELARACGAGEIPWAGAALPTPQWAQQVFPDKSPDDALELLWEALVKIIQLDKEDPTEIWKDHGRRLKLRGEKLTALNLKSVHFKGPGTDLTIACLPHSTWIGGACTSADGVSFIPNIPTFENFTTPDYRYTDGRVRVTCPIEVMGTLVEGAWFVFEKGKVVDYGADKNVDALKKMFSICPQASYLGELALVDGSSPIYQSGILFFSGLYDENATCHIALGNGYVTAANGAEGKSEAELLDMGVNVSLVHHDFMIGSDEIDVDGIAQDGTKIPLIRNGLYTDVVR